MNDQEVIKNAILSDAEGVIAAALRFAPGISAEIAAARQAPGPLSGVAAIAVRYALRGADNAATLANMGHFVKFLNEGVAA